MSDYDPRVSVNMPPKTLKKVCEIDPKLFVSNAVKDTEVWSWKRKKFEKWIVFFDSSTGHLKTSRVP